ncbi:zinc finger protein basonuclin-1 isoform X1 [Megalops cyprinoides]|uniref:zinc finger protein basonuclin-1 isoform X1 n=1 Tax=Megalops cyprinoides TaxID=118141 RepID=UPI001863F919|nr:zinc finger protein basonuclin-1 isoform X1 [Megalops cyprinoides]
MEIQAICCTLVNCSCESFKPGKLKRRQCENCKHGWVAHALSKLKVHHMYQGSQVEIVHSNVVFDICSLMLYGTQAIPVRLKILLDRLFSVLKQEEVVQILNALDWTLQDYIRGYVLQDVTGKVLDRWAIMTFEEEIATLQQFLRFGETKSIVELMAIQDKEGQAVIVPSTRTNSDIRAFIESNAQRGPGLPTKVEKLSTTNVHHFENFINSMAFMLPFQFLSSVPAPLLGSSSGSFLLGQEQRREHQTRLEDPVPVPAPATEGSLLGSSSASFTSDVERCDNPMDTATPKVEAEDFPTSDNYSDAPSTPCTPSMSSDVTQMSPETKMRSLEKSGGGLKKGRVFCSACEKTFYDKGTLKIHYNAVHLKIKHKCTIEGCNMVFSSLRSRNRHSANPNPRLHMPMNRNNRDKDLRGNLSVVDSPEGEKRPDYSAAADSRPVPSYIVSSADSKLPSGFPNISQSGILFPNLKTVQPVLPFYRSLVTPAELANTPGALPSLPMISSSVLAKPAATEPSSDPVPKKKSRKSSMPIKIEKEVVENVEDLVDESSADDEAPLPMRDRDESDSGSYVCEKRAGSDREDCGVIQPADRENSSTPLQRPLDFRSNAALCVVKDEDAAARHAETGAKYTLEGGVITCTSPFDTNQKENHSHVSVLPAPEAENCTAVQSGNKPCSGDHAETDYRATNGGLFKILTNSKEAPEDCTEDYEDTFPQTELQEVCSDRDDLPRHCEICSKTFKNPYSVKMHYRNVHLKEMHMCTVEGCHAAFPSRRSRDRHSANLNLHHKLLTKDPYGTSSTIYPSSSLCRDVTSDSRQDFAPKDPVGQTSVIFKGNNRMGLVFPMSKTPEIEPDPPAEAGAENEAVLDLSTTSVSKSGGSARSSWDSDGGSEDGFPMDDSDESCDGLGGPPKEGLHPSLAERPSSCPTQHLQGGSPITCHICQKVYSNKGTFRAHYKTVHLRLLHKCKVPGCDTTFSSVRSRNRHSQNPNLHRNLTASTVHDQE